MSGLPDLLTTSQGATSRLVIEAISLPRYRIHAVSGNELRIDLPGSILVMAPDCIAVNDGLISSITVASGLSHPYISAGLEHLHLGP